SAADSKPVPETVFKIYVLRVSTLESRSAGKYEVAWKTSPRGSSRRPEDSTPMFAEMAMPGTVFEGAWRENEFLRLRLRDRLDTAGLFRLVNSYTAGLIGIHK